MHHRIALAALIAASTQVPLPAFGAGDSGIRTQTVQFAKGESTAQLNGSIKGDATVDYKIGARAGQTLTVAMKTSNPSSDFNVNPPGANGEAMFIGRSGGDGAKLLLPTDGNYVVRVYLMRNAARRNETGRYTLSVGVTGQALAPLPASQDARIAGTPFHALAAVTCQPSGTEPGGACQAFVIRRGHDGTATVEVRGANGLVRRVLFVKGSPVASDSAQALTATRVGDVTTVRVGADERFEIPDALVSGG